MKKIISILVLATVICAGCATRYSIVLNDGEVLTARGKPKFDQQKGYYTYKAADGQTNIIFAGKVREVAPSSMVEKSGTQFIR